MSEEPKQDLQQAKSHVQVGCTSVVESVLSMREALGSIPITTKGKKKVVIEEHTLEGFPSEVK